MKKILFTSALLSIVLTAFSASAEDSNVSATSANATKEIKESVAKEINVNSRYVKDIERRQRLEAEAGVERKLNPISIAEVRASREKNNNGVVRFRYSKK